MIKVFLLKQYNEYNAGEIISVSNNVAFGLVDSGVARNTATNDFMTKTDFGETKAFGENPSFTRNRRHSRIQ